MHPHTFLTTLRAWTVLTVCLLCAMAGAGAAPNAGLPIKVAMIEGLSGPFTNTGEAAYRNLAWAAQNINADGGVAWG